MWTRGSSVADRPHDVSCRWIFRYKSQRQEGLQKNGTGVTEVDKRVADFKDSSEAASFHLFRFFLVVRDVTLGAGLRSAALRREDNIETGTSRVDGPVVSYSAAVCVDLVGLVVRTVVDLYVVERTTDK